MANGFAISEYQCGEGPDDPVFEELHRLPTLALVQTGRFTYHGEHGTCAAEPGMLLLGNPGRCYACSHEDSTGDHCLVLHFEAELFAEAASACGCNPARGFAASVMPASAALLPHVLACQRQDHDAPLRLLAEVLKMQAQSAGRSASPSPGERRAVRRALDWIEAHLAAPITLEALAAQAAMSKFHFARCFSRVTGTSPYRYVLLRRLAIAAHRLAQDADNVGSIAYDCGFGDLSTFNARFKSTFGQSPTNWRRRAA